MFKNFAAISTAVCLLFVSAAAQGDNGGSRQTQDGPFRYWVILRSDLHYEQLIPYRSFGVSWNTRLTLNVNWPVDPFIGTTVGVGPGIVVLLRAGAEKAYTYNNGLSITPSCGVNYGVAGISASRAYHVVGVDALAELAFWRVRFSPYLQTGIRINTIWHESGFEGFISLPLGAGLLLKI